MSRGFLWSASENRLLEQVFKARIFLALFIGFVSIFAFPTQVRAADCSAGSFSAGGYFFANYESVEYSPEGHPVQHLKVNYPDGRPFRLVWSYYDDECNIASVTGNQVTVSLPPGVSDWSVRLVSPTRIEIWNDQNNSVISGFDIPLYPVYTSIAFGGTIDGGASTFGSRILKINQNGQAPTLTGTLPLPSVCPPGAQGSAGGFSQYFFDSYEHAEYVDGLLRVHLRLKTPYNDGRTFSSGVSTADANCNYSSPSTPLGTSITAYARYFSFRMTSSTHWELWNDEINAPLSCIGCSGDVPAGTPFVAWGASIDGSASTLQTTPFSPVEFSGPVYAECCSSVVFLPGIQGSRLLGDIAPLWPPAVPAVFGGSLDALALNADGESVNQVYVDGVIDSFYGTPVYSGFSSFMDDVVAQGTIAEWEPLPYDWRFSPEKILADGVNTPAGHIDLIQEIENVASRSDTGQVTIVAHSMGGLMGKAIIKRLEEEGKANLIDSFVMVGTPQLGTPQAAAGLLHGDTQGIPTGWILPGIIVNPVSSRTISHNMQSAYNLLPSARYFEEVSDPVLVFDENAGFTADWRNAWGVCMEEVFCINNYLNFFAFLTGGTVARLDPPDNLLRIPDILDPNLVSNAASFHSEFDNYTFPPSIRVVQIAGWGVPTTKAVEYRNEHFLQNYRVLTTGEGDKSVVYPSAIGSSDVETFFFNLDKYREDENTSTQHKDLVSVFPVQDLIKNIINEQPVQPTEYILISKPEVANVADLLVVSSHSPVVLGVHDASGHFTGVNPGQDSNSQFLFTSEDIPGSSFIASGESQYLLVPKGGNYTFKFLGTGTGPTTIDIGTISNDVTVPAISYSDIPVTTNTSATFVVDGSAPTDVHIQVDTNNDGQVDSYVAPDGQPLTLAELLINLKTKIQGLDIKDKLRNNLLKKIEKIEKKITKQKNNKASKVAMNLEKQITRKGEKGKISDADVNEINALLDELESRL